MLEREGLLNMPELIVNMDETGVNPEHNPESVVCPADFRNDDLPAVTSSRGNTTTVVSAISAAGLVVPPFFIFKGVKKVMDFHYYVVEYLYGIDLSFNIANIASHD